MVAVGGLSFSTERFSGVVAALDGLRKGRSFTDGRAVSPAETGTAVDTRGLVVVSVTAAARGIAASFIALPAGRAGCLLAAGGALAAGAAGSGAFAFFSLCG